MYGTEPLRDSVTGPRSHNDWREQGRTRDYLFSVPIPAPHLRRAPLSKQTGGDSETLQTTLQGPVLVSKRPNPCRRLGSKQTAKRGRGGWK